MPYDMCDSRSSQLPAHKVSLNSNMLVSMRTTVHIIYVIVKNNFRSVHKCTTYVVYIDMNNLKLIALHSVRLEDHERYRRRYKKRMKYR